MCDHEWTQAKIKNGTVIDVTRYDNQYYTYEIDGSKLLIPVSEGYVVEEATFEEIGEHLCGACYETILAIGKNKILKVKFEIFKDTLESFVQHIVVILDTGEEYVAMHLKDAVKQFLVDGPLFQVPEMTDEEVKNGSAEYLPDLDCIPIDYATHYAMKCENSLMTLMLENGMLPKYIDKIFPREGNNIKSITRAITAIIKSTEVTYEHKIYGCAYLLSKWADVISPY